MGQLRELFGNRLEDPRTVLTLSARSNDGSFSAWGFSFHSRIATLKSGSPQRIDVSPGGWDGEMIGYPCVFEHRGRRYMLYNGNRYGATGFGAAIEE